MPGTCTMQAPRTSTRARRGFRWQQALERKTAPLEDAASQAFALCERWSRARTALTAAKLRKVSEVLALQDPSHAAVRRQRLSALLVERMISDWCFSCGCEYSSCVHGSGRSTAAGRRAQRRRKKPSKLPRRPLQE